MSKQVQERGDVVEYFMGAITAIAHYLISFANIKTIIINVTLY